MLDELESIHQQMPYFEVHAHGVSICDTALLNAKKIIPIIESHADIRRHSGIT
jgi:hypothetical protein